MSQHPIPQMKMRCMPNQRGNFPGIASEMQEVLLRQQHFLALHVVRVVHTAVHRTNRGTLGLIVEPDALGTFLVGNVVNVLAAGFPDESGVQFADGRVDARAPESRSVGHLPVRPAFVNGVVGALWFACAAIDAGVGDHDGHGEKARVGGKFGREDTTMEHNTFYASLVQLGAWLRGEVAGSGSDDADLLRRAEVGNAWFTPGNVRTAMEALGEGLRPEVLAEWRQRQGGAWGEDPLSVGVERRKRVGLVLAGNLAMVGWHDVLCVLMAGHEAVVKCSRDDAVLIPAAVAYWGSLLPEVRQRVTWVEERLPEIDALVVTGSGNTTRHFDYYFRHLPRLLRGSRTGVAVLDGQETDAELRALGQDVFLHFGLGCRSATKLFVPEDFDVQRLFAAWMDWAPIAAHNKYANNVDYHRAVWLLNGEALLENGLLLLKEDAGWVSPVGSVFYSRYADVGAVWETIAEAALGIQCLLMRAGNRPPRPLGVAVVDLGQGQFPKPWDYADGADTLEFLHGLHLAHA